MNLEEAREIAKNYQKPTFYDHEIVLILDDRITELEAQRDGLVEAGKAALFYGFYDTTTATALQIAIDRASDKEDKG